MGDLVVAEGQAAVASREAIPSLLERTPGPERRRERGSIYSRMKPSLLEEVSKRLKIGNGLIQMLQRSMLFISKVP